MFFIMIMALPIHPAEISFSIVINVSTRHEGELHLFLVDAETFKKKNSGIKNISKHISKNDSTSTLLQFHFENVPGGEYGIRCYIDKNMNGTLDMGMFGPKEPYGISWNGKKVNGPPKFKDISFELKGDFSIDIQIE